MSGCLRPHAAGLIGETAARQTPPPANRLPLPWTPLLVVPLAWVWTRLAFWKGLGRESYPYDTPPGPDVIIGPRAQMASRLGPCASSLLPVRYLILHVIIFTPLPPPPQLCVSRVVMDHYDFPRTNDAAAAEVGPGKRMVPGPEQRRGRADLFDVVHHTCHMKPESHTGAWREVRDGGSAGRGGGWGA